MRVGQRFNPHRMFTGVFVPDGVYTYPGLSALAKLIYGRLCKYKGERGDAYPAALTIAKELDISERQAFEHLSRLEDAKLIEREPRPGTSTVYHLIWHDCFEYPEDLGSAENRTTGESLTRGKPQAGSAENRTTGSAENRRRSESIEESQGRDGKANPMPTPSTTLDTGELDPETGEEIPRQQTYKKNWKRPKAEKPHAKSDRLRELREAGVSGSVRVTAPTTCASPTAAPRSDTPPPPPPIEPAAPQRDCVAIWNESFPELAVDPDIYQNGNRPYALRDGSMLSNMPDVVVKVRWLVDNGSDVTFSHLIRKEASGVFGWSAILSGSLDWTTKKRRDKKSEFHEMIDKERKENDELVAAIKRKRSLSQGSTTPAGVPSGVPVHNQRG